MDNDLTTPHAGDCPVYTEDLTASDGRLVVTAENANLVHAHQHEMFNWDEDYQNSVNLHLVQAVYEGIAKKEDVALTYHQALYLSELMAIAHENEMELNVRRKMEMAGVGGINLAALLRQLELDGEEGDNGEEG